MNGRDGITTFIPLDSKIGGKINCHRPSIGQFLTREQASYVYKKVEMGEMINASTIQQVMDQEEQLSKIDDTNGEINPYRELIINNAERIEPLMAQMEQWSILSNILNYIQHDRHHTMNHNLSIGAVNKYKNYPETKEEREFTELNFGSMPQKLCEEYLDVYEDIQSEIVNTTRFGENFDLSMAYLGNQTRQGMTNWKQKSHSPSEHGYTLGKLLDGTQCQLLLDMGASKSFMSKSFYMQCKSLHSLPKFASKTQRIHVGNGQCVSVLFIITIIIDVHRHKFEIYMLVSEIHENVDLVLGIKNVFKLEDKINSRDCFFKFLNRSIPIFPESCVILKPNKQKLIKVKAPFIDEISGLAIVRMLDGGIHSTLLIKLKFTWNKAILDIVNKGTNTMIFKPEEMLGVIDLRSLGYYKIKQGITQQNLSRYYQFDRAEKLCKYFNKFVNTLKKEREQKLPEDKYLWLDQDDEQRYMIDKEILDKYINLDNPCLNIEEKKEVMDLLYRYKEAFSLKRWNRYMSQYWSGDWCYR